MRLSSASHSDVGTTVSLLKNVQVERICLYSDGENWPWPPSMSMRFLVVDCTDCGALDRNESSSPHLNEGLPTATPMRFMCGASCITSCASDGT